VLETADCLHFTAPVALCTGAHAAVRCRPVSKCQRPVQALPDKLLLCEGRKPTGFNSKAVPGKPGDKAHRSQEYQRLVSSQHSVWSTAPDSSGAADV
jgi:hypothetical protein